MKSLVRFLHRALVGAVLLVTAMVAAPAFADTDFTDAWWAGTAQNGWGLAFTQNDSAIYTQFFHYDANHNPTWFGGTIYRQASGHYNGAMYIVSGDYYGHMPYDPTLFHATAVGSIDFFPTDASHGQLSYTLNGVTVLTQIQRLTLVNIPLAGSYIGYVVQTLSAACFGSGGAQTNYVAAQIVVTESGAPGNVGIDLRSTISPFDSLCSMNGPATQWGRTFDIPSAAYQCGGVSFTPLHVSDLRRTANGGIEGTWQTVPGDNCVDTARFVGVGQ
ncbi:MAG TPA: hypothetical protein VGR63_06270 [Casimicrobiaceae bacterium]|jgi:hypothetical protein|nr:hypothetical protein [Casimicrobiaceae bacterium]